MKQPDQLINLFYLNSKNGQTEIFNMDISVWMLAPCLQIAGTF